MQLQIVKDPNLYLLNITAVPVSCFEAFGYLITCGSNLNILSKQCCYHFSILWWHDIKCTSFSMELESCQNPAHTQNVFCSRITIHTHTKRVLLTHNDSHTRSVWFANTKHHSQTNVFCFNQVQTKIFQVQKKSFKYTKQFYKYGTLKAARGSEGICARISKAEN